MIQTWKTETIPQKWQRGQESVQVFFSDWIYVFFTDTDCTDFVETFFPEHLQRFLDLPYAIQRADVIRYMVLYVYGGLYMDMDYTVQHDFRHLFTTSLSVLHSIHVPYVLTNSIIAAHPSQDRFLTLISYALYTPVPWYYGKHLHVMFTTGPMAFDKCIRSSHDPYTVLPNQFLTDDPDNYTIPLEGQSWNALDSAMLNALMTYRKEIGLVVILGVLYIFRGFLQYKERVQKLGKLLKLKSK